MTNISELFLANTIHKISILRKGLKRNTTLIERLIALF